MSYMHYNTTRRPASRFITLIRKLLRYWPLWLALWCVFGNPRPHVLWDYTYDAYRGKDYKSSCNYYGWKSKKTSLAIGGDCSYVRLFEIEQ